MPNIRVELATESDLDALMKVDSATIGNESRRGFILEAIRNGECVLSRVKGIPAGFAIFNESFFEKAFVWLLVTDPDYRRMGIATSIIGHIESICKAEKLFT